MEKRRGERRLRVRQAAGATAEEGRRRATARAFIAGIVVVSEPAANAMKSVRLVSVIETPACRSARPMRTSADDSASAACCCSRLATMMYMSSTPRPSASSGIICENGV